MKRFPAILVLVAVLAYGALPVTWAQEPHIFEEIALLLTSRCVMCHRGTNPPLGLRLEEYADVLAGSRNGAVIIPGKPDESELVRRIKGVSQPRMPLGGPWLTEEEISLIERWITAGAEPPKEEKPKPAAPAPTTIQQAGPATYATIAPIFGRHCVKCHMTNGKMGTPPEGLRLDTYENILRYKERAVVIPGNPDGSELVRRIRGRAFPRMPLDGPPYLLEDEIKAIEAWVSGGARDAEDNRGTVPVGARVRLHGRLTGYWTLDGMPFVVDPGARLKKGPEIGDYVEVRGVVEADGAIRATRIRPK